MTVVLVDWVLKLELSMEDHLCPIGLLSVREDPSRVVLGLYHEDTKPRNQDVVNLGRPTLYF